MYVTSGATEAWTPATDLPEHVAITPSNETNGASIGLEAEKIVAVTMKNEVPYMAVKWKGIPRAEFVDVHEIRKRWPHVLIAFYEANLVLTQKENDGRLVDENEIDHFVENGQKIFPETYTTPKEILASVMSKGELFIILTWNDGVETASCVPARIAHQFFPEMLISFYESKVVWK